MKCIFTLGSPAIGGGTNVIFEHASRMVREGEEVYIVTKKPVKPEEKSKILNLIWPFQLSGIQYMKPIK